MKRHQLGFLTKTVNLIFYLIVALCLILFFWNIVTDVNLEKDLENYTRLRGPFFIILSLFLLTNIFFQIRSASRDKCNGNGSAGGKNLALHLPGQITNTTIDGKDLLWI